MFLARRTLQAEYLDSPELSAAEAQGHYAWLARINRLTQFDRPFRRWLPATVGLEKCPTLKVLDLGAGDGSLGRTLAAWAKLREWDWRFTSLDLSPHSRLLNPSGHHVIGTATDLQFHDEEFDAVIANSMAHHLASEADVVAHLREAGRVARCGVLLCDLHRNPIFAAVLWVMLLALRAPAVFRCDGVLSVRRGWRVPEWRRLAAAAGLRDARVWSEHGTRVLLQYRKSPRDGAPPLSANLGAAGGRDP